MLTDYKGNVTVKIDGIAASAASVVAMAGNKVLMSPVSMMMIHNPATFAFGDHAEMQKAMAMLDEVKESIINAYVIKTGLSTGMSRTKLSHLMDAETWMNANMAIELGFADDMITKTEQEKESIEGLNNMTDSMLFSRTAISNTLQNKLEKHYGVSKEDVTKQAEIKVLEVKGTSASELKERLNFMKRFI